MHKKREFLLTALLGAFLLLPLMALARQAAPVDTWAKMNDFNTSAVLYGAASDITGTAYVAVGSAGTVLYSTDGVSWSDQTDTSFKNTYRGVVYGSVQNRFVAVGDAKTIRYSSTLTTDGLSFAGGTGTITGNLKAVTYGAGRFVVVGDGGRIFYSDDGIAWTQVTLPFTFTGALNAITYDASHDLFVAVGAAGVLFTSPDGIFWIKGAIPSGGNLQGIAYGGGKYIAVNAAGSVFVSNGTGSWTPFKSSFTGIAANLRGITYRGGYFVVAADKGYLYQSVDGIDWWSVELPGKPDTNPVTRVKHNFKAVGGNGGLMYAVGDAGTILTSASPDNPSFWFVRSSWNVTGHLSAATYGNGRFVLAGQYGNMFSSSGSSAGTIWGESRLETGPNEDYPFIEGITFGGGLFIAVGDANKQSTYPELFTSPDGVTWTLRSDDPDRFPLSEALQNQDLLAVAFGAANYVAVGTAGTVLRSANGITWTFNSVTGFDLTGIAYDSGSTTFVAVGNKVIVTSTDDGASWSLTSTPTSPPVFQAVTVGSAGGGVTRFVAVAANGSIWTADTPVVSWTQRKTGAGALYGVTYGTAGAFTGFVAVGASGSIWESADGVSWSKADHANGSGSTLEAVAAGNNKFVVSGSGNMILLGAP